MWFYQRDVIGDNLEFVAADGSLRRRTDEQGRVPGEGQIKFHQISSTQLWVPEI